MIPALRVQLDLTPLATAHKREDIGAQIHHRARIAGDRERRTASPQGGRTKIERGAEELGPDIQWVESYVAGDKTFCVYLAQNEEIIHEHSRRSGFPANKVTEVRRMIDPTTATET